MMKTHTHEELVRKFSNYDEWKNCITVLCGIPLTMDYIEKRIVELNDASNTSTEQFVKIWGESHRKQVVTWFEQAKKDAK